MKKHGGILIEFWKLDYEGDKLPRKSATIRVTDEFILDQPVLGRELFRRHFEGVIDSIYKTFYNHRIDNKSGGKGEAKEAVNQKGKAPGGRTAGRLVKGR